MATKQRTQKLLQELHTAVYSFEEERMVTLVQTALAEGIDPFATALQSLAAGTNAARKAYAHEEYFVPALLIMCADALNAGPSVLPPVMKASGREVAVKGSIVLGVMEENVHNRGNKGKEC